MPIYEYGCNECTARAEDLFRVDEAPAAMPCPRCSTGELRRLVSLPAHTPGRWGDQTGRHGVNGVYDRGLGARYHTSMERERLCKERGLVPLSDLGDDWWQNQTDKQLADKAREEGLAESLLTTSARLGGDMSRAIAEVMPARDILAGKYDIGG